MGYDRKGKRFCDGCGRLIAKAHRRNHGDDYCATCYPRLFIRMPCRLCGELARFHRHVSEAERVCGTCARARRKCLRCGKALLRAAKRVAGGAVCASCAHYFTEKRPCPRCGRASSRLSRVPASAIDEPICDRCRNRLTHKTCSVCHRYRRVAGTLPDGKPYCSTCTPGISASHACPRCGAVIPGTGRGLCVACLNRERIVHETRLQELALSQPWARELYADFGGWLAAECPANRRLLAVLARHFGFFERLDAGCRSFDEVTGALLLDRVGVAGLRAHTLPMRYLRARHSITINAEEKTDHVERQRIRAILERSRPEPWGAVLERYSEWLEAKMARVRTRRLYLSTAAQFCRIESVAADGACTSEHVQHFLKHQPGLRANLFRWNAFGKECLGCVAEIPLVRRRRRNPRTVRDLAKLLSAVDAVGLDRAPVKLLERTIAKSFGYTVAAFLEHAWSVESHDARVWLCRPGKRLGVPAPLTPVVVAWARRRTDTSL